ncbi:MAG: MtrAB system histidine kinase MtrB [Streptosporangiaceae bacterium]|jgi:two-component system sensor histidine kinase MtrB
MTEAATGNGRPWPARWLSVLGRFLSALGDGGAGLLTRMRVRWHSSLQLRVVTTTLVISAIVVSALGVFLMQQITASLLASKIKAATSQVDSALGTVQSQKDVYSRPTGNTSSLMYNIAQELGPQGVSGSDYGVAVIADRSGPPVYSKGSTVGIYAGTIPVKLVQKVELDRKDHVASPSFVSAVLRFGQSKNPVAGYVFGAPFGSIYQLYYFFPLTQEQQNLALVHNTLLFVGIALVFLVAAIAGLVTRWVVVPVQQAAQAARRLSTGRLDDRIPVRGSDELAALATSFNEMAASLKDKMAELEELSQVQRQFVSDVSHELRTPMTTIRIAAEVIFGARDSLKPDVSRSAELLESQLERFESLLIDLLEISRYDANAATLDAEPVDICDIVRHSADVAQQLAERRSAKIEFRLPPEPCVAEVDRRRLERILRNLLVNAVEHGENRDAVVTVAGDRDAVAVAVRDYGVGLRPGEEQLVFDRFWRADPARARTTGGTGLGLSIALEDARLHGGWLEAWGEPGRGSVFRLTLPRTVRGELVGSPLPLGPDEADLDALAPAARTGTVTPAPDWPPGDEPDLDPTTGPLAGHGHDAAATTGALAPESATVARPAGSAAGGTAEESRAGRNSPAANGTAGTGTAGSSAGSAAADSRAAARG